MNKKAFNFDFEIAGISRDDASIVITLIKFLVEKLHGTMAGGFVEVDGDEDGEASNEQEVPE